jgi:hypothetical protein
VLSTGDSVGAPGYVQLANAWLIVNVGGGPTPDKPDVTLTVPSSPNAVNSFMNIQNIKKRAVISEIPTDI